VAVKFIADQRAKTAAVEEAGAKAHDTALVSGLAAVPPQAKKPRGEPQPAAATSEATSAAPPPPPPPAATSVSSTENRVICFDNRTDDSVLTVPAYDNGRADIFILYENTNAAVRTVIFQVLNAKTACLECIYGVAPALLNGLKGCRVGKGYNIGQPPRADGDDDDDDDISEARRALGVDDNDDDDDTTKPVDTSSARETAATKTAAKAAAAKKKDADTDDAPRHDKDVSGHLDELLATMAYNAILQKDSTQTGQLALPFQMETVPTVWCPAGSLFKGSQSEATAAADLLTRFEAVATSGKRGAANLSDRVKELMKGVTALLEAGQYLAAVKRSMTTAGLCHLVCPRQGPQITPSPVCRSTPTSETWPKTFGTTLRWT